MTKAAGAVNRAEQRHQHRKRADRLEAVGVRGQSAHRMKGHRIAGDRVVRFAPGVGPWDRQRDPVVAAGLDHFAREAANRVRRDPGDLSGPLGRAIGHAFAQQRERRRDRRAVSERIAAVQRGRHALCMVRHGTRGGGVPPEMILRKQRIADWPLRVTHEQAEVFAGFVEVDQFRRIRIALHELVVPGVGGNQFVQECHEQRAVGAWLDRHPLVGNRGIAGADRIDGDKAATRALELRNGDLKRIRMVIFRRADHEEEFGAVQIGAAEFPERAADRIDHAGRHVGRAEAAMGRVIRRAELFGKEARERLHLVAASEQGEFLWIRGANRGKALLEHVERDFPRHRLELCTAPLGARLAHQGLGQARGRVLLHDAGGTLGADHPLIQRMLRVAVDVAYLAFTQMHANAAATGAHVTGGRLDLQPFVLRAGVVFHAGDLRRCSGCVEAGWVRYRPSYPPPAHKGNRDLREKLSAMLMVSIGLQ